MVLFITWFLAIVKKLATHTYRDHDDAYTHTHTHTHTHRLTNGKIFFSLAYHSLSVSNNSTEKTRQGLEPTIQLIVYSVNVNNRLKCTQT